MTSLATIYWQLYFAPGRCVGIGLGMIWLPSVMLTPTDFVRYRTLVLLPQIQAYAHGTLSFSYISAVIYHF